MHDCWRCTSFSKEFPIPAYFLLFALSVSRLTVSRNYEHYELITHLYSQHEDLGHIHNNFKVNWSAYPETENHYITDLFMLSAHRKDNLFVGLVLFFFSLEWYYSWSSQIPY